MPVYTVYSMKLSYDNKWSTAQVLDIPAVPLYPARAFGQDADGWHNRLVFGDNLGVLAALVQMKQRGELQNADGTDGIRVCYIDPPFATGREFTDLNGKTAYTDKVTGTEFVEFLRRRLILIHELIADNGTLYVHLDTKKSHYVKVVLDEIFGEACFQSEIVWKNTTCKGLKSSKPLRQHDTILMYTKSSKKWVWNRLYTPYSKEYLEKVYTHDDKDGKGLYRTGSLQSPGHGKYHYTFRGHAAPTKGWVCPEKTMERWAAEGRIWFPPKGPPQQPRRKRHLSDMSGIPQHDLWLDISTPMRPIYPTEKPQALLDRVIESSSNQGDLVLDCFTGSGSTLRAAERLGRRWVGVDAGKLSIETATRELLKIQLQPFTTYNAG